MLFQDGQAAGSFSGSHCRLHVKETSVTVQYLVNLGIAQLYFDGDFKRCPPPGSRPVGESQTIHFVRLENDGSLLTKTWDRGLAEFSESQRGKADLYRKIET